MIPRGLPARAVVVKSVPGPNLDQFQALQPDFRGCQNQTSSNGLILCVYYMMDLIKTNNPTTQFKFNKSEEQNLLGEGTYSFARKGWLALRSLTGYGFVSSKIHLGMEAP